MDSRVEGCSSQSKSLVQEFQVPGINSTLPLRRVLVVVAGYSYYAGFVAVS